MAVAYVSAQSGNNSISAGSTTNAVTPGTAIAAGSLVFGTAGWVGASSVTPEVITATDGTNTYTVETAVVINSPSNTFNFTVFYFINTVGSHATVTVTFPGSRTFSDVTINTFSGVGAGTLHAKIVPTNVVTTGASANNVATGTFAATAGDLLVGASLNLDGNGTLSAGTTLAWQTAQSIASVVLAEYILSSAGGTPAATWGNSSTSDLHWGVAAYSFTPAAAAAVTPQRARIGYGTTIVLGGAWRLGQALQRNGIVTRRSLLVPPK